MNTSAVSLIMPVAATEPPTPKNADEAAGQFEALLLTQMLRAARSEADQEDSTMDTMWDMAAQQFAQVMADAGGLGLARMIREDLKTSDVGGAVQGSLKDLPKNIENGLAGTGGEAPNADPISTRLDQHKYPLLCQIA